MQDGDVAIRFEPVSINGAYVVRLRDARGSETDVMNGRDMAASEVRQRIKSGILYALGASGGSMVSHCDAKMKQASLSCCSKIRRRSYDNRYHPRSYFRVLFLGCISHRAGNRCVVDFRLLELQRLDSIQSGCARDDPHQYRRDDRRVARCCRGVHCLDRLACLCPCGLDRDDHASGG